MKNYKKPEEILIHLDGELYTLARVSMKDQILSIITTIIILAFFLLIAIAVDQIDTCFLTQYHEKN